MSKPDLNKRQLAIHLLLVTVPVGALIGTAVAGFEWIVNQLVWESLSRQLTPEQLCLAPTAGMILTGLIVRTFRVPSTAMADDIVRVYHEPKSDIHQASILPKITASITTIGLGCSAGLEGASKWLGGVIAWTIQRFVNRLPAYKNLHEKLEITMIAGAAAGIAAIFRAPLSGIIMGTESPYRRGMAHEALIHSLFGAAVSYVTYTSLQTAEPYFRVPDLGPLTLLQVLWCVPLGVIAGITSRLFLTGLSVTKRFGKSLPWQGLVPNAIGGILISVIALATLKLLGEPAVLQSGLNVSRTLLSGGYSGSQAGLIFVSKSLVTILTFALGGVGGLFLPSATIGASLGAVFDFWIAPGQPGLFTMVGIAAFTGASYNSLLFAAVFVAEASGQPTLVVPSLIASGIAYIISLGLSNSPSQS